MGSTCGLPTAATTRCRRSTPRAGRSWRRALRTSSVAGLAVGSGGVWIGDTRRENLVRLDPDLQAGDRTVRVAPDEPTSSDRRSQTRWPSARAPSGWVADTGPWPGSTRRRSSWSTTSRSGNDPVALATGRRRGVGRRPGRRDARSHRSPIGQRGHLGDAGGPVPGRAGGGRGRRLGRQQPERHRLACRSRERSGDGGDPRGAAPDRGGHGGGRGVGGEQPGRDRQPDRSRDESGRGDDRGRGGTAERDLRRRQGLGQRPERRAAESHPGLVGGGGTGPRPVRSRADRSRPRPRLHAPGGHLCPALQLSGPARPRGGPAGSRDRGRAPNGLGRWTAVRVSYPLRLSVLPAVGRARHGGLLRPGNRAHARSPDGCVCRLADGRHRGSRGVRGRPRGRRHRARGSRGSAHHRAHSPGGRPHRPTGGDVLLPRSPGHARGPQWRRPPPVRRPVLPGIAHARAKLRAAPQPELRRTAPAGTRRDPLRHRLVTGARTRRGRGGTSRLPRAGCVHGGRAVVDRRCRGAGRPPRTG